MDKITIERQQIDLINEHLYIALSAVYEKIEFTAESHIEEAINILESIKDDASKPHSEYRKLGNAESYN